MLKTNAFVLRRQDFRDYDRIYTIYTSDFGKMSLLARGARKIKSKLAPHLESFGEVRVNFARGKVFTHLSGAGTVCAHKTVLANHEKIALISECFRLLDKFVKPEEGDTGIYDLLRSTISAIGPVQSADLWKVRVYFFWRLIDILGYRPQLDECALCGNIIEGKSSFNITENILFCGNCANGGFLMNAAAIEHLRAVFNTSLENYIKLNLDTALLALTEKAKQVKLSEL